MYINMVCKKHDCVCKSLYLLKYICHSLWSFYRNCIWASHEVKTTARKGVNEWSQGATSMLQAVGLAVEEGQGRGRAARALDTIYRLLAKAQPTYSQPILAGTLRTCAPFRSTVTQTLPSFGSDARGSQRFHESLLPPGVDHRDSSLRAIRGPQVTC